MIRWAALVLAGAAWVLAGLVAGCTAADDDDSAEPTAAARACNGLPALCGQRVDQVTFLRTHNSHASEERGYSQWSWNHVEAMPTQLADGVRAVNMDVYLEDGAMLVCHGYCFLGQQPFDAILDELTTFLAGHPHEVILLSLQNEAPWDATLEALTEAGIGDLAWSHTPGVEWPTLGELLEAGTPLLVSAGGIPGDAPAWLHRDGDLQWGDHWGAETPDDLDCELENPAFPGGLYFYNNVLTAPIANPDLADLVNHEPELGDRLIDCGIENGRLPNIVSVDFYALGDTVAAIQRVNQARLDGVAP